jgi:uncharacterized protein
VDATEVEVLVGCSHGRTDTERATVPFIIASTAAAAGQRTAVVCTAEGVWTGTRGYADEVALEGLPPLRSLVDDLLAAGGEIWLCSACTGVRGIEEADTIDGARIVGAAQIVEATVSGGRWITPT